MPLPSVIANTSGVYFSKDTQSSASGQIANTDSIPPEGLIIPMAGPALLSAGRTGLHEL
jgi:hypothetical protein